MIEGKGKLDFHACRVAYTTFVVEAGATVKEAQELLRHSTAQLTMNAYARTRDGRLAEVVERVGDMVLDEDGSSRGHRGLDTGHSEAPIFPQRADGGGVGYGVRPRCDGSLRESELVEENILASEDSLVF